MKNKSIVGCSIEELETISGSGKNNRVNKADILAYLENKSSKAQDESSVVELTKVVDV